MLVAVLAVCLSGVVPLPFVPSGARADSGETIVPILSPDSQAAWGFMVEEATGLLAQRGVPAQKAENRARDEIRAFLVIRILEMIEKPAAERTAAENTALARLTTVIQRERGWTARNAYARFQNYEAPSNCFASSNPEPTFIPPCLILAAFGDHPGVIAYTGSGYEETFESFYGSRARVPLAGAIRALPFWSSLTIEGTPEENALLAELKDVYAEKIATEAAKEVVSEVATSIFELAGGESVSPISVTILGLSVAAIIGYGVWNTVDLQITGDTLLARADSAESESVDLSILAEPEGLTELLYIIVSETLPQEPSAVNCSFDPFLTCHRFEFGDDPDYVTERYDSLPMPPHASDEPHFEVRLKDDATFTGSAYAQLPDRQMKMWSPMIPNGPNSFVVATNYDPTATRIEASFGYPHSAFSHVSEGMLINSDASGADPYWRWSQGLDYVDWEGQWWIAWLHGETFVHTKVATPLHGNFTPTDELSLAGLFPTIDGCVENPPFYSGALEGLNPVIHHRGTCLLTEKDVTIGDVAVGDRILINGVARTVRKLTTCQHSTSAFSPNESCVAHGPTAIIIEPTGSTVEAGTVQSSDAGWGWQLLGVAHLAGTGSADNRVMRMADHDTCAGYATCLYPPGDVRNCLRPRPVGADVQCFESPTIEYRDDTDPTAEQEWSATLVPALKANPDAYIAPVNDPVFTDNTLQVAAATGVLTNDVRPTQTATVVTGPTHGVLSLSLDGSFDYTPDVGYGASSPQHDEFTYRICDGGNVVPNEPERCSEAVVSLTVENAPPTASVGWLANAAPDVGHLAGLTYSYHDREGDREGLSRYAWYRDDQQAPVGTGRTYSVSDNDAHHFLWFSVTPVALTGTSPGAPVFSDRRLVNATGTQGITFADLVVDCGPLTNPILVGTGRTCTATVTRRSDELDPDFPVGTVHLRTLDDGAFAPDSCTLGNFRTISSGARSSCAVTYVPGVVGDGIHTIVGLWSGGGEIDEDTTQVAVVGLGPAPTAANDAVSTDEDTPLSVVEASLLSNDTGTIVASGFRLTAGSGPSHGTLVDQGNGALLYTPAHDFHGSDGFGYQVCDTAARCVTATVAITIAPVNDPPVAAATSSATLECSSAAGAVASFDGSGSSDVDSTPGTNDDLATFEWFEDYGAATQHLLGSGAQLQTALPLGTHLVTLEVTDHASASATAAALTVTVADTQGPTLVCPVAEGAVECTSNTGTPVTLVASATDGCGGPVTITNDRNSGGADASGSFPPGTTAVGFTAKDAAGNEAHCATSVVVQDTTPPLLTVSLVPGTLWPPNHRMVDIQAVVTVTDACGTAAASLTSVTSSEPDDAIGLGDGKTTGDIQGAAPGTADLAFALRAERDGNGPGRVYTVVYTATDASGQTVSATGTVFVPHDERATDEPVSLTIDQSDDRTTVTWQPVPNALQYTVVRGDVANLHETDAAIEIGAVSCTRTGPAALSTAGQEDTETPPVGHAYFYLAGYDDGWGPSGYGTAGVAKPRVTASGDCR